jgi:hypothetical protein
MTTLKNVSFGFLAIALVCVPAFAQTHTLTQTSTSAAVAANDTVISVSSATNILAPNTLSGEPGESMRVFSISGTRITVARNSGGKATAHASGAMVLVGEPNWFYGSDPSGSCVTASTFVTPYVNTENGRQWLCSTVTLTWVPGFQNTSTAAGVTTLVASAAGAILPSGPLFHVNGTAAITDFTIPVGFNGGSFCIIADAAYTTTATNKIAFASTGVAGKVQCWAYDTAAAKFYASY